MCRLGRKNKSIYKPSAASAQVHCPESLCHWLSSSLWEVFTACTQQLLLWGGIFREGEEGAWMQDEGWLVAWGDLRDRYLRIQTRWWDPLQHKMFDRGLSLSSRFLSVRARNAKPQQFFWHIDGPLRESECLDVLLREPAPQGIALDWKIPGQG